MKCKKRETEDKIRKKMNFNVKKNNEIDYNKNKINRQL